MSSFNLWSYSPSPVAALIFLVLFAIATIWHVFIMCRRRTWYFIVLIIGGCFEIAGYIARYLATTDQESIAFFIVQTLCILVAPALFAASIYMVLGRLTTLVRAEAYSPIRPRRLTKTFVLGDLLSFIVQILGAGVLSNNFNLGKTIILVGLVAQLIFFGLFVTVSILVWRRLGRNPTPTAAMLDSHSTMSGWRGVLRVVFISSALISIRSVFRLIEFTGDHDSPMQTSEAYLYVCDSLLMFGVLAVLIYLHPSDYMHNAQRMKEASGEEMDGIVCEESLGSRELHR